MCICNAFFITLQTGSKAHPVRYEALPAYSEDLLTCLKALSAGSEALPPGSKALPAGSEALLAGSKAHQAGSETLPASSMAHPADSEALLSEKISLSGDAIGHRPLRGRCPKTKPSRPMMRPWACSAH